MTSWDQGRGRFLTIPTHEELRGVDCGILACMDAHFKLHTFTYLHSRTTPTKSSTVSSQSTATLLALIDRQLAQILHTRARHIINR
jgi:predicted amidohydrolase